ncbi:MAG: Swr1 complex bromodomain subunit Brf1 [Amphiamblys sp. WSBS2006]|nr:MAG: Swr1 complex bromodomain subunit Brf1 [Amphiamblys sp. WSBS2006]
MNNEEVKHTTQGEAVAVPEIRADGPAEEEKDAVAEESEEKKQLLQEQLKFCGVVLKGMRRHKDAAAFLHPVDPVALGIPDYFDVIKTPMDLGTVQEKHSSGVYKTPDEFIGDVSTVFTNCSLYNNPETMVYKSGQVLEKYFSSMLEKMPQDLSETKQAQRRQRERQSASAGVAPKAVLSQSDYSFCNNVLRELVKKKHRQFVYPFMIPVDTVALGIPDYPEVIKEPMDISTARKKLDEKAYENAGEFKRDLDRIVENCLAYNQAGTAVHNMGIEFAKLIKDTWEGVGDASRTKSTTPRVKPQRKQATEQDIEKEIAWRRKEVDAHLAKINDLTLQLAAMTGSGWSERKKAYPDGWERALTRDEKVRLSEQVKLLTDDEIGTLLEIIKKEMPSLKTDASDENVVEIDIDNLNTSVLRKIQQFVEACGVATGQRKLD